jgi:hypothetical protein
VREVAGGADLAEVRIVVSTVEASNAELRGDPRRLAGEGDAGCVRDRPTRLRVDVVRAHQDEVVCVELPHGGRVAADDPELAAADGEPGDPVGDAPAR